MTDEYDRAREKIAKILLGMDDDLTNEYDADAWWAMSEPLFKQEWLDHADEILSLPEIGVIADEQGAPEYHNVIHPNTLHILKQAGWRKLIDKPC